MGRTTDTGPASQSKFALLLQLAGESSSDKPLILVRLMREGASSRTLFLLAFAKLTDADYATVARLMEARDMDGLALLCRATGFDRALFLALTLSVASEDNAMSRLDEFGALYERVPALAAQRAVRFWKLRANVA